MPHTPGVQSAYSKPMLFAPSAAPAWVADADSGSFLVPTEVGRLMAVTANGAARVLFATDFPLRAQPLADGGTVFLPGSDGVLYAIAKNSGAKLWSQSTGAAMLARPCVVSALFAAEPTPTPVATPIPTVTPATTSPVATPNPAPIKQPLLTSQRIVIVGNDAGVVAAFAVTDGKLLWKETITGAVGNGITPIDDADQPAVLIPSMGSATAPGGLWCLEARTGKARWQFPRGVDTAAAELAAPAVEPAVPGKMRRVFCADDNGAVYCLDVATGTKQWKTYVPPLQKNSNEAVVLRGEPALLQTAAGLRLYIGGNDGGLRCLDPETGNILWVHRVPGAIRAAPQGFQQNGRELLLVDNDSESLPVLDAGSGAVQYAIQTAGPALASAVNSNGRLSSLSGTGNFQIFKLPG